MPTGPLRECHFPLCGGYARTNGYCLAHQQMHQQRAQAAPAPGVTLSRSSARFRKARRYYLLHHPVCAICRQAFANILDHVVPHRGIPRLYWDQSNWQGLCVHCHAVKTSKETNHL
jgi:5-methylcytosine-specific restriction protein A